MSADAPSAAVACMRLVSGYQVSRAIYAAAELGIFDRLEPAQTAEALAPLVAAHAPTLYRLLRALAAAGVLHEDDDRRFSLTAIGACLRGNAAGSLAPWALSIGRPYYWAAWSELPHAVRTGEPGFAAAHGMSAWDWRAGHADDAAAFNRAMTAMSQRLSRAVPMAYDFSRFRCVVDVGGGSGSLLAAILRRTPAQRGVLFDLPGALGEADAVLRRAGVEGRVRLQGGSFFEALPDEGDAYVLCNVLHNWSDDDAKKILASCRAAMREEASLFVIDSEIAAPNRGAEAKFLDLNMLVMHGARERTRGELETLFDATRFAWVDQRTTALGLVIVEARPRA